jgi:hypothetical protein
VGIAVLHSQAGNTERKNTNKKGQRESPFSLPLPSLFCRASVPATSFNTAYLRLYAYICGCVISLSCFPFLVSLATNFTETTTAEKKKKKYKPIQKKTEGATAAS